MARTKQTARKSCLGKCPRRTHPTEKKRKRQPSAPGAPLPSDQQELQDVVNTQQFLLKFDDQETCESLAVKSEMIKCSRCAAYFTVQSTLIQSKEYKNRKQDPSLSDIERQKYLNTHENVWICEFCLRHNSIPKAYSPPKEENPCIILNDQVMDQQEAEGNNKMLIFCIDISGSMDYVFEGKSRLESVKQAIKDEISRLKFEKEKLKVGLITFGSYVNLIGDGRSFKQQTLKNELIHDFQGICRQMKKVKNFCFPIEESFSSLKSEVNNLSTYGSTALGPGLLTAVELASRGSVGSKVILCTDGEANVGIGGNFSQDRFTFYTKMAEHAKKSRVMVSILSLKGDKCNLKELGKLSLATGGSVLKINPSAIGTEFSKIIKENIIGSSSKLVVKLNQVFKICNGTPEQLSPDHTTLTQDFGNFSAETELSFEFEILLKEDAVKNKNIDLGLYSQKRVPMQIQLEYTGRKGQRYLQIVTDWREVTDNFDDIYEGADFGLFAISVLQRTSQKIKTEQFEAAQAILRGYHSLVEEKFKKTENSSNIQKFNQRMANLQRVLNSKMKKKNPGFKAPSAERGGGRGRGKGGKHSRNRSRNRSRSRSNSVERMLSDSEEEVIWKEMRARNRSRSRSRSKDKKKGHTSALVNTGSKSSSVRHSSRRTTR